MTSFLNEILFTHNDVSKEVMILSLNSIITLLLKYVINKESSTDQSIARHVMYCISFSV